MQQLNEIAEALLAAGASVRPLRLADGLRPILVGYDGDNYLFIVKGERNRHSLSLEERLWVDEWEGQAEVVCDPLDALMAIGAVSGCKVW